MTMPSPRLRNRGFTLVELLIALVLFLAVSSMLYASIQLTQRTSRAQTERSMLQGNLRAAVQTLAGELGELQVNSAAGTTDIVAMTDSSITYRAMRASGVTCEVNSSYVVVRNTNGLASANRAIVPGRDSLLLFVDTDTLKTSDDAWLPLLINSTPSANNCPDGTAGVRYQVGSSIPVANVYVPGPIRSFEVMQLATLRTGGYNWLGARSVSAVQTLQPYLGPIDSTTGIRFTYRDASGAVTASRSAVRQIDIMVRGATRAPISDGITPGSAAVRTDSLRVQVAVRNSS